ncbi:MAG TPA: hypothetical protein VGK58_20275 [Lacipirellulaceae bacterium]
MLRHRAPKAYSLLEIVLASGICATALVPALALLRDGVTLADRVDARHLLLLYGVSKMEEHLAIVAAGWTEGTFTGNFATEGHANVRYIVVQSDEVASGGIVDRLMNVEVTTYRDEDGDAALDAGEMRNIMRTKIGRFTSYENKAGG